MTRDLRNIYNNLFSHLRGELSDAEAQEFRDEVNEHPEVGEDMELFRSAQMILREKELIDFKAEAKQYAAEQKQARKERRIRNTLLVIGAGVAIAGATYYFSRETEQLSVSSAIHTDIEVSQDEVVAVTIAQQNDAEMKMPVQELLTDSSTTLSKPKPNQPTQEEVNARTEVVIAPKQLSAAVKEPAFLQPEANAEPLVEKNISANVTADVQVAIPRSLPENTPSVNFSVNDAVKVSDEVAHDEEADHIEDTAPLCSEDMPETYAPSSGEPFEIYLDGKSAGTLTILDERMRNYFTRSFDANEVLEWDGSSAQYGVAALGVYKIIVSYRNGQKCIYDLTVIDR